MNMNKKIILIFIIIIASLLVCCRSEKQSDEYFQYRDQRWLYELTDGNYNDIEDFKNSGKGIRIAIIDIGFDLCHPDLSQADITLYEIGQNPIDPSLLNHGTGILGVLCAFPHDNSGVIGLVTGAKILAISLGVDNTNETNQDKTNTAIINAINKAVSWQAQIISMSFMFNTDSEEIKEAIDIAYESGCVIIAADGGGSERKCFPASYDNVISVGTLLNGKNILGCYDCVLLPADNVVSICATDMPSQYNSFTGASMAAPMLTGMVAIGLQNFPDISNQTFLDVCKLLYDKTGTTLDVFLNLCSEYNE